jgi:hypothetical protein
VITWSPRDNVQSSGTPTDEHGLCQWFDDLNATFRG